MPPHLHPRSRLTSSLFATTLLASFVVVGIPHILPCPAPRLAYADGNGVEEMVVIEGPDGSTVVRRRRRRRCAVDGSDAQNLNQEKGKALVVKEYDDAEGFDDGALGRRARRECPVPKPGGILGEVLGFKSVKVDEQEMGSRPPSPPSSSS